MAANRELITEMRQRQFRIETDDEISLVDLWLIGSRRKWQILAGMLTACALATLYLLLVTPTYLSRAVIAVGEVPNIGNIESPELVVKRLQERYSVGDETEGTRELPYLESVNRSEREAKNVVELTALGRTGEEASSFLQTVTEQLIADHATHYRLAYDNQMQVVKEKERFLNETERESARLSGLIGDLTENNASQASILMMERSNLLLRKADAEELLRELQARLTLLSQPTRFLREPTLPVTQKTPKALLVLTIAFIGGLFLGIFAALFSEFLAQVRRHARRLKTDISP
jgi:uncharacterized protein involved in exopolysaccharide biosynthesis